MPLESLVSGVWLWGTLFAERAGWRQWKEPVPPAGHGERKRRSGEEASGIPNGTGTLLHVATKFHVPFSVEHRTLKANEHSVGYSGKTQSSFRMPD